MVQIDEKQVEKELAERFARWGVLSPVLAEQYAWYAVGYVLDAVKKAEERQP